MHQKLRPYSIICAMHCGLKKNMRNFIWKAINFIWKAINRHKIYHTYDDRHGAVCLQCRVHAVMSARRSAAYRIRMSGFGRQLRFESFRMHAGLAEVVPRTVSSLDSGIPAYPKEFQQRAHAPPGACVCLRKEADVI